MKSLTRRGFVGASLVGATALSFGGILSSCNNASTSKSGSVTGKTDEVVVVMGTSSEPEAGFDPFYSWGCGEHVHEPLIQSTLVVTNENMGFTNDLAVAYSCSNDRLTWTFEIRTDVKFTDGKPLTARDVVFTINGIKNFEGSELDLSFVKEAKAPSDYVVEIALNKPCNALLYTLAVVGIVPEHAYDSKTYGANPIGSGRYKLEQWDKGQQAIFVANPDYYGKTPHIQRFTVLFASEDGALAAAQGKQADIVFTSATLANQSVSGYELFSCKSVDSRGISLPTQPIGTTRTDGDVTYNAGNNITCNQELRQAINYAIDREVLVKNTLNGYGAQAYSVCDSMPWASDDMKVTTDKDKAAKILTDAGWKKGTGGIYAKDGVRAAFTLMYPTSDSVRQAMANEFSNQMRDFGIEVNLKGSSWTKDADGLYAHQYSDPILWGWGANTPMQLYDLIYSSSAGNYAVYENATIDAHIDAALAKVEVADSYDEWRKAQWDGKQGVAPQGAATWVWLANVDHLYFKRQGLNVAAQKLHPHGHGWSLVNNIDEWTW